MIRRLLNGWFDGGVRSENRNTIRAMRFSEGSRLFVKRLHSDAGDPSGRGKAQVASSKGSKTVAPESVLPSANMPPRQGGFRSTPDPPIVAMPQFP
jgi:hypothetical protein